MRRAVTAASIVLVALAGAFGFLRLGFVLSSTDAPARVDVVVVPSGDPDNRLPAAIALARRGHADRVWVTVDRDGPVSHERDAVLFYARGSDVPVEVLGVSASTVDDAELVRRALRGGPVQRIGVVTSPVSAARTRLIFGRVLRSDVPVWADRSGYDAARWWQRSAEATLLEAGKSVVTLAVAGARPQRDGQPVPGTLPWLAFGAAFGVAAASGAAVRPLARRLGFLSHPRPDRAHEGSVPLLGGLAVLLGAGGGVLAAGGAAIGAAGLGAAGGVATLAFVGLADDLVELSPRTRLLWPALAGSVAWLLGLRVELLGGPVDVLLTVAWFVAVTHAVNILDNLDGAAAGVAAVSSAAIAAVAVAGGQWMVAAGAASLAGACGGYLVHNVHPARLFLGDLGSLGIGFGLASLALAVRPPQGPALSATVPVLLLGVPLFDAAMVTISRVRAGRRVSTGGTDHTAHRLVVRGLPVRWTAAVLWMGQAALGLAALGVAAGPSGWAWVVVCGAAVAGAVALVVVLRMPSEPPPLRRVEDVVELVEARVPA